MITIAAIKNKLYAIIKDSAIVELSDSYRFFLRKQFFTYPMKIFTI